MIIRRILPLSLIRLLALVALALSGAGALAQEPLPEDAVSVPPGATAPAAEGKEGEGATPAAVVRPSGAAFMKPLGRLSSILGSVHFLRRLCGDANADVWRQKMDEILVAQAPNEPDRQSLVAAFNSGYRAFESTYRTCTPAARLAVARYQEEGATLSREISARYGN